MTRAERDKLTVPAPEFRCEGDMCIPEGSDYGAHPPDVLRWHEEDGEFEAGWYCDGCGIGGDNHATATDVVLADVLAERFHNVEPANPCGNRSRHRWVADGSEPLQCNRPAGHVEEKDTAHAHFDHQTGLPIAGWTR